MVFYYEEKGYIYALMEVLDRGEERNDRTGVGVKSIFGDIILKFDLSGNVLPLITTKKMYIKGIVEELKWFLRGSTDSKELESAGVFIWKGNSSKEFLESRRLSYEEGDIGPGYGYQWRYAGAKYPSKENGVDQIKKLIDGIREDPYSRRHILNSWNVADLDKMALPPCHCMVQYYVSKSGGLKCIMTQRSADMFLGIPFNIASYAILTHLIAKECGLYAESLQINIGDAHIYKNHFKQCKEQIARRPKKFPTIKINGSIYNTEDKWDIDIIDYDHDEPIRAEMAI